MARKKQQASPVNQTQELEPLLTIEEVQRILQLSKPKVYELMIRPVLNGGTWILCSRG